eukprot:11219762-Lingulodinium_polyedra.AAC.1
MRHRRSRAGVLYPSTAAVGADDRKTSMLRERITMQKWHGLPLTTPRTCHVRLELRARSDVSVAS